MTDTKIVGDDGQFHAEDEVVDLSGTTAEAWLALGLFWLLGLTVLYQFVTRYVFNDSAAWTEEIARYLLVGVVFVGAAIGVRKNNHIQVDFFYRHMPLAMARAIGVAVDVLRTLFYAAAVVISTPSLAHSYWLYAVYSDRYALSTFSFAVVTASCAC